MWMIICFSSQECHSQSSLDQSNRNSEQKYSVIKYTVGLEDSVHLKQSQKKSVQNSPGIFLTCLSFSLGTVGSLYYFSTSKLTKYYLNTKPYHAKMFCSQQMLLIGITTQQWQPQLPWFNGFYKNSPVCNLQ